MAATMLSATASAASLGSRTMQKRSPAGQAALKVPKGFAAARPSRTSVVPQAAMYRSFGRRGPSYGGYAGWAGPLTAASMLAPLVWQAGCNMNAPDQQQQRGGGQKEKEQQQQTLWFPTDWEETSQHYRLTADVPGLGRDNIKVEVDKERSLTVSGSRQRASQAAVDGKAADSKAAEPGVVDVAAEGDAQEASRQQQEQAPQWKGLSRERRFGSFRRSWQLPEDADVGAIRASVDKGVLTLSIGRVKPAEPEVTTIPIN